MEELEVDAGEETELLDVEIEVDDGETEVVTELVVVRLDSWSPTTTPTAIRMTRITTTITAVIREIAFFNKDHFFGAHL
jgi:hypothetical protein